MPTRSYKESLLRELKNPEYAAEYLTACLEESPEVFLLALRDVAEAYGDQVKLLKDSDFKQESLSSVEAILEGLGFGLSVTVKEPQVA
jgi:DNA-binding phage protein